MTKKELLDFKDFLDNNVVEHSMLTNETILCKYLEQRKKSKHKKPQLTEEQELELPSKVEEYNNIFPAKTKIPTSGKYARVNAKELMDNFRWFLLNHSQYSWSTILDATNLYVEEYRMKNWNYMSTSAYVIRKQQVDRTSRSILADYCQQIADGVSLDDQDHGYREKIV